MKVQKNLKILNESFWKKLKENLTKENVYHATVKVFEPTIDQQKKSWEDESNNNKKWLFRKGFSQWNRTFADIFRGNNKTSANLGISKALDSGFITNLSNFMNSSNKSQFSLTLLSGKKRDKWT